MLATKSHGVRFANDLGRTLEHVLLMYRASLEGAEEGVPVELRRAATGVPESRAPQQRAGPGDAVAGSGSE
ncbi:MAG: hypothetical protein VCE12_00710, partial [Candidatus Latescibacterota bacterium]